LVRKVRVKSVIPGPLTLVIVASLWVGPTACSEESASAALYDEAATTNTGRGWDEGTPLGQGGSAVVVDVGVGRGEIDTTSGGVRPEESTPDAGPLPSVGSKFDDVYLVPPGVASRGQVAASDGWVAWVERATAQEAPVLVVWEVMGGKGPEALRTPNLVNPSQLVLSAGWLVYVDDRYGDADLFAVDLETGLEEAVVAEVGAQVEPAVRGDVVAWRDCRGCVGEATTAAEIYRVDLSSGEPAQRVTVSESDERGPALGLLADGTEALAWIEGERRLRVRGDGVEESWEVGAFVSSVDVADGVLTWREATGMINPDSMKPIEINPDSMKPVVEINPDSMIPSDVYGTEVATGVTYAISVHAELSPEALGRVHAASNRVAWTEANPEADLASRLVVADAATGKVSVSIDVPGLWSPALASDLVVFIAPREDNAGLDDVWVLPLEPSVP
jgi:hypothetical protein